MLPILDIPVLLPFKRTHGERWMTDRERAAIIGLLSQIGARRVIEIGCNEGHLAFDVLHHLLTIDIYTGIDIAPFSAHLPSILAQHSEVPGTWAGRLVLDHPKFVLQTYPRGSLDLLRLPPCDAVIIDGDHSEAAVRHDTALATAAVRQGGVIIWHDYADWEGCGVPAVLESLDGDIKHVADTALAVEFR